MPLADVVLDDAQLISFCKERADDLGMLSQPSIEALERLHGKLGAVDAETQTTFLTQHPKLINELWYNLLVDALHALKLRDQREEAAKKGFDDTLGDRRTDARKQNVYGINQLWDYFKSFESFEGVLYGGEPTYRDHVTHVLRVWLIGVRLLVAEGIGKLDVGLGTGVARPVEGVDEEAGAANENTPDRDEEPRAPNDLPAVPSPLSQLTISNEELWAMWTVAALCHDLGYPLQKTYNVNRAIDNMLQHFGQVSTGHYLYSFQQQHHALTDETLKLVSSKAVPFGEGEPGGFTTQVQEKFHIKLGRSLASLNHGIVSCVVLMQTLVYFMETDYDTAGGGALDKEDCRQFHIRREILRAIAGHTCTDIYHLQIDTLAFLLILCDELQEWGRPVLADMKLGGPSDASCHEIKVNRLDLDRGLVDVAVTFGDGVDEDWVKRKFREYHKLLRPAKDDAKRSVSFVWQVTASDTTYRMTYDSAEDPFSEPSWKKGGNDLEVYSDPEW